MDETTGLSLVIPCFNSEATIGPLVERLLALDVAGGHEVVLVNDGSRDRTAEAAAGLAARFPGRVTFVDHARNYGEHAAVMTGLRHARGRWIVTMDDDGQNPPSEALRLFDFARASDLDVVYTRYPEKRHAGWRNFGSWLTNKAADLVIDKPKGLYLCSFRAISAFVAAQVTRYEGPYPYVDGLIFQVTQRVGAVEVEHVDRAAGRSGYTLRRLVRLWMNMFLNFSVLPLRVASVLGLVFAGVGFLATAGVALEHFFYGTPLGWGSIMCALLVFSGVQLLLIGIAGEYLGRLYLTANRRPQSVVRRVVRHPPG